MIAADNIFAGYHGLDALCGVSISARPGEMLGLLGPNGAGKSTLLRVLAGILVPCAGKATLGGENLFALSDRERAKRIGVVPQFFDIPYGPKVSAVTLMGRYAHAPGFCGYCPEDHSIARQAMEEAGVAHLSERALSELSGGEQKRVFIARALAQQAPLLLLDEAVSGLDPARAIEIADLLRRKCHQGATVILAIHDLNLAALYCDRMVFLKQGRVAAQGPTRQVFTEEIISRVYETSFSMVVHPSSGVAQALFASEQASAR